MAIILYNLLSKIIFLDIFFTILDGAGDDDDDDESNSDWLFELQEPEGKRVQTQVACQHNIGKL